MFVEHVFVVFDVHKTRVSWGRLFVLHTTGSHRRTDGPDLIAKLQADTSVIVVHSATEASWGCRGCGLVGPSDP